MSAPGATVLGVPAPSAVGTAQGHSPPRSSVPTIETDPTTRREAAVHAGLTSADPTAAADAALVACLLAMDPAGLVGARIRGRPGPAGDRWLGLLRDLLPAGAPLRRLPPGAPDSRLLGGLDLGATLRAGRPVVEQGVLAASDDGVVVLPMAERLPPGTAARIAAALDSGEVALERDGIARRLPARLGLVALDEGLDDEAPPAILTERLAFHLDLGAARDLPDPPHDASAVAAARARLPGVEADGEVARALCAAAASLGIVSLRPPLLALRAARCLAALAGRDTVAAADAATAARLVLAPRATVVPQAAPPHADPPPDHGDAPDEPPDDTTTPGMLDDVVLAAAQAAIPPDLLAGLRLAPARGAATAGRSGAARRSARRGQPIGTAPGELRPGARLSLVETLRAAAPWQPLRAPARSGARLSLRREDIRLLRFRERTETTAIFAVDASGSSALHRLAEAKGAVELLLAECYARRDRVAVIAFRGTAAAVLLPPTSSLTRAKRSLAGLPGGGATPLAAGLDAATALAEAERRAGRTPLLVLLTDGRANVARDGTADRARASDDADAAARRLRATAIASLLVDTAPRPQPAAARLAAAMGARYVPLPHADAARLSGAVRDAQDARRR